MHPLEMTFEVQRRSGAPTVIQRSSEAEPKNLSSYPFANGYEFRFLGLRLEMTIERLASTNDNPHKTLHINHLYRWFKIVVIRSKGNSRVSIQHDNASAPKTTAATPMVAAACYDP